jgi:hypothetical protein
MDFHLLENQNTSGNRKYAVHVAGQCLRCYHCEMKSQSICTGLPDANKMGSVWLCTANSIRTS